MDNGQFAEDAAAGYAEVESTEVTAIAMESGGDGDTPGERINASKNDDDER